MEKGGHFPQNQSIICRKKMSFQLGQKPIFDLLCFERALKIKFSQQEPARKEIQLVNNMKGHIFSTYLRIRQLLPSRAGLSFFGRRAAVGRDRAGKGRSHWCSLSAGRPCLRIRGSGCGSEARRWTGRQSEDLAEYPAHKHMPHQL